MQLHDAIIGKIRSIPPLSEAARQIIDVMSSPEHHAEMLMHIIGTDAALTARVLRVINSAPGREPVTTIENAIACLGDKVVLGIALDYCTDGLMHKPLEGYLAEQGKLWEHNLLAAVGAKMVAQLSPARLNPDEAFTGGILHDIGKAVLSEFLRGSADELLKKLEWGVLPDYLAAEEEKLGTNHCIIGAAIARAWKLPPPFPEIIRHHHHPQTADRSNRAIVYAVHIGDIIAMMMGGGTGSDAMYYQLDSGYAEALGIHKTQFPAIMLRVGEEFEKAKAFASGGL